MDAIWPHLVGFVCFIAVMVVGLRLGDAFLWWLYRRTK